MSKFAGIVNARRDSPEPAVDPVESPAKTPTATSPPPSPAPPEPTPPARRGRPPGKRSSDDHEQVTAYIRRDTYRKVRLRLIEDGDTQDFSTLIEGLLSDWLRSRT